MPQALIVAAAVAGAAGPAYAALSAALTLVSIGWSAYDERKNADAQQDALRNSLQDRTKTYMNSAAARRIVYGRQRMGGDTIIYHVIHGARRDEITMVIPVAPHRIDGFESYWLNDTEEPVSMLDGTSTSSGGGGWVLPGSKWYVNDRQLVGMEIAAATAPSGSTHAVMANGSPVHVTQDMGIAYRTVDGDTYVSHTLTPGVDYTVTGVGASTVTFLTDQSAHALIFNFTYDYTGATVRIKFFLGLDVGERDLDLEADSGGEWTATDLLCGVARMHITLHYNSGVFGAIGAPNPSATFRGAILWDWATSSYRWSQNSAMCLADYLTREDGHAYDPALLVAASVQNTQSVSDEWVPRSPFSVDASANIVNIDGDQFVLGDEVRFYVTGGSLPAPLSGSTTYYIVEVINVAATGGNYRISTTAGGSPVDITTTGSGTLLAQERRYTTNTVISTDSEVLENLRILQSAMVGNIIKVGGQIVMRPGAFSSPVYTLDESDLTEDEDSKWEVQTEPRTADLYNCVRGTFVDNSVAGMWSTSSFDTYESATYIAQDDGQRRYLDVPLAATLGRHRAQRIAKLMLHKSRLGAATTGGFKPHASPIQPQDVVHCPFETLGWHTENSGAGKMFIAEEVGRNPNGRVDIALREEFAEVYDWNFDEAVVHFPQLGAGLPDPSKVDPVGLLTFASSATSYESLEGGRIRPFGVVGWPAVTQTDVLEGGSLRLKWRALADGVMQELPPIDPTSIAVKIYGIAPGQKIIAQMVAVNSIGAVSPISIGAFTVASDLPSSEVKASGNLLSFSTLVDTNGLTVAKDAGATDAVTVIKSSFGMNDTPGSVLLQQIGRQQVNKYLDFPPVPVEPGQAYAAYAFLTNARCTSDVRLNFLNEAGALVSEHASDLCTTSRTSAVESGYDQFGVRVIAPATAAKAVLRIRSTGTDLADVGNLGSGTYVFKPFVGPIASATAAYPTWNTGAAVSSRTQDIAPGAVNRVRDAEFTWSGSNPATGTFYGPNLANVCQITFTPDFTGVAMLTAEVAVYVASGVLPVYAGIAWPVNRPLVGPQEPGSTVPPTQQIGAALVNIAERATAEEQAMTIFRVRTIQQTVTLQKGVPYTPYITVAGDSQLAPGGSVGRSYVSFAKLRMHQVY
ncbi:MAG: phage tail protein [Bacteroidia bacterium]